MGVERQRCAGRGHRSAEFTSRKHPFRQSAEIGSTEPTFLDAA